MKPIFCPNCKSQNIKEITDGYYRCMNCGFTGSLDGKGIVKK